MAALTFVGFGVRVSPPVRTGLMQVCAALARPDSGRNATDPRFSATSRLPSSHAPIRRRHRPATRSPPSSWACSARSSAPTGRPTASPATASPSAPRTASRSAPGPASMLTPHADLAPVDDADLVAVPAHADGHARSPGRARRAAPRRRPGRVRAQRLLRRVRARRGRACSTAGDAPPTGSTSTSCSAATPPPRFVQLALRPGRPAAHQRRHRRRHRRLPAPGPPGARLGDRHQAGPADGGAAAPGRRAGPVHRGADPADARRAHPGAAAGVADGPPGPAAHRRRPGRPRRTWPPDLRPPVPRRDRHHPARLADQPAGAARPAAAGGDRAERRGGRRPRRASATPPPCGTTSPAASAPPRRRYRTTFRCRAEAAATGSVAEPRLRPPGAPSRPRSRRPDSARSPARTRRATARPRR